MKNKPYVIGVAGGSGSGKTVFLNCFLNHFKEHEICLVSQDDYYKKLTIEMTADENRHHNFDLPDCIETNKFENDINLLLASKTVYKEEYTFNNPTAQPKILEIKPAPILIIEGLFIYHYPKVNPLFDYRIFIDAPENIALERRLKRDLVERGYSANDVHYKWNNHVMPSYQKYLLPHKETCHQIIENDTNQMEVILELSREISERLKTQLGFCK
ncbi:MAG: uridine kinase [Sphingobacteriales bacterium]|nr:MAG: uridine kinase [Sphingobacteriales bacterium]